MIGDQLGSISQSVVNSSEYQRRLLELQLIQTRQEAAAARLEARAAELERLIWEAVAKQESGDRKLVPTSEPDASSHEWVGPASAAFSDWDQVRSVLRSHSSEGSKPVDDEPAALRQPGVAAEGADIRTPGEATNEGLRPDWPVLSKNRKDDPAGGLSGSAKIADPMCAPPKQAQRQLDGLEREEALHKKQDGDTFDGVETEEKTSARLAQSDCQSFQASAELESEVGDSESASDGQTDRANSAMVLSTDPDESRSRRSRPAAWAMSAATHLVGLLLLAGLTLQSARPKDQVALTASASQEDRPNIETLRLEVDEPVTEVVEPTTVEAEVELSPNGEIEATPIADIQPIDTSNAASLSQSSSDAASTLSSQSKSQTNAQFCGVQGGGNHFVYLVDSSSSMDAGFESARAELMRSIEQLRPDQRFYVVFFDAQPDYMRLMDPTVDEPSSVPATVQNKISLQRWAMQIAMDRGKAPYEPLRFALKLKPDVIFLLSDGEFPAGIEELLRNENKIENLFGDSKPISIVHTIGYHSRQGEARMRRIADQNQGQYRHVPKPRR